MKLYIETNIWILKAFRIFSSTDQSSHIELSTFSYPQNISARTLSCCLLSGHKLYNNNIHKPVFDVGQIRTIVETVVFFFPDLENGHLLSNNTYVEHCHSYWSSPPPAAKHSKEGSFSVQATKRQQGSVRNHLLTDQ